MKAVIISDTHGRHEQLILPKGDLIIHAGDVSMRGMKLEIEAFLEWFSSLDFRYKVFIAGNHDFFFEFSDAHTIAELLPQDVTYLNDSSTEIEGIKIWGSPITPWFHDWAFNRHRGPDIKKHWDIIPVDTDVVITHGPVHGILDKTKAGYAVGCEDLMEKINEIRPKYHICGHIHEAYGMMDIDETCHINASILDLNYHVVNEPIEIEMT
jgi:Icc-related predicted phosphoesterase